jgi:hypothetical protein
MLPVAVAPASALHLRTLRVPSCCNYSATPATTLQRLQLLCALHLGTLRVPRCCHYSATPATTLQRLQLLCNTCNCSAPTQHPTCRSRSCVCWILCSSLDLFLSKSCIVAERSLSPASSEVDSLRFSLPERWTSLVRREAPGFS